LPTVTLSVPLHNSPQFPTSPGLPPLPLPTTGATTCITLLGQPVCTPRLGRAGLDPALAKMMMPGVTG
ncbi:MAG TPA: mammalian cell entry protein, partial [Kribbella sp.]